MLSGKQVERIEAARGKAVRWRVEKAPSSAEPYSLKQIIMNSTQSLTMEVNRCINDDNDFLLRQEGFATPFNLVGIYDSDIDVDWILEDIAEHEASGE